MLENLAELLAKPCRGYLLHRYMRAKPVFMKLNVIYRGGEYGVPRLELAVPVLDL